MNQFSKSFLLCLGISALHSTAGAAEQLCGDQQRLQDFLYSAVSGYGRWERPPTDLGSCYKVILNDVLDPNDPSNYPACHYENDCVYSSREAFFRKSDCARVNSNCEPSSRL